MKAEILTIGDELISGGIVDTNSSFISVSLASIGIKTTRCTSVGDDALLIRETVHHALEKSDLIILTGGIGPTDDDITRETISGMVGKKLVINNRILSLIEEKLGNMGLNMAKSDKKQALFPEGAEIVDNPVGIAGGFIVNFREKPIIVLPGVPRELRGMLKENIIPFLAGKNRQDQVFKTRTLKVFGIVETRVEECLRGVLEGYENVKISFLPDYPENHIRITVESSLAEEAEKILFEVSQKISQRLEPFVFGCDAQTLESVVGDLLRTNNMTLAVAESCTGGLITHRLTNIPGSSDYLNQGVVAYSNQAKIDLLGVRADLIKEFGAVSDKTACSMAQGVRKVGKSSLGLAVTGVAGPGGGTKINPVGRVFIALTDGKNTQVKDYQFPGGRELIKLMTSQTALNLIRGYFLK